jgi:hypothetical protein
MKTCTKDNCERLVRARGLCSSHYNQEHQPNRHAKKTVACAFCGTEVLKGPGGGRKYGATCSDQCRQWLQNPYCPLPADHWARWYGKASAWKPKSVVAVMTIEERGRSQRTPLRIALEDGLGPTEIVTALRLESVVNADGCWVSKRQGKDGYPIYQMALKGGKSRAYRLHRIALEAKLGKPLGSQAAHHMCANSSCINPEHLQPISFRENTAEMMQRNYYITRIKELEAALSSLAPAHHLLNEVGLPQAA